MSCATSRRQFLNLVAAGWAGGWAMARLPMLARGAAAPAAAQKPNIILAMADDMGWGDVGFNGNTVIKTPHLDEMARASLRFERFYSGAPVCSPTRGSCLTGRHPYRYGIWFANAGHMRAQEITLAEALKTQGYATGHFGKWHLGTLNREQSGKGKGRNAERNYATPGMNGSDEWFATEYGVRLWDPMENNKVNPYYHNGKAETENTAGCDSRVLMDRAIPFIRQAVSEKKPFFAVIWFHAPHEPIEAGPEFRALYPECDEGQQHFYGVITALDVQMGRLRQELRDLGVADNTMLWFASDNGPEGDTGDKGRTRGATGGLRGRKRSLFEGGVRVPGLLEWPARVKPGVTSVACSTLDYFPTTLDILGFRMPGQPEPIDGVSLAPLIEGTMKERPVPIPFETTGGAGSKASRGSPKLALIDNRFKLLSDMNDKPDGDLLFDLLADRAETTNIAAQHPDIVKDMKAKLQAFRESCRRSLAGKDYAEPFTPDKDDVHPMDRAAAAATDEGETGAGEEDEQGAAKGASGKSDKKAPKSKKGALGEKNRPGQLVLQNDDSGIVSLTAAAAATHGALTYRDDQDKIGQWQNEKDWLSWEFQLHRPGEFEVEASLGQTQGGSVYEIAVGDQTLKATVVASGDYTRAKTQTVGVLKLDQPGAYTLTLKPVTKAGAVVMTLWRIDLIPAQP